MACLLMTSMSPIYPTEVRINGEWIKVENQRMDGAIAITHTPTGLVARCKLLRDLEVGEQVVVDVGIRTIRKPELGTQHPGIQLYVSWGFQ